MTDETRPNGPRPLTRRRFLRGAATVGAGATAASLLPGIVERAFAAADPAGCGSLADIDHFIFVMQENRSFDHYFGTLSGVRGFDDPTAPTQNVGGETSSIFRQYGYQPGTGATATGYTLPFALQQDSTHDGQVLNDPTHDWGPQHGCWNGGRMDKFLATHVAAEGAGNGPIVMSHYDRQTLPFYYALADAFTVCDAYHCSVIGPTYPNRMYWMSGTLDPDGKNGGPLVETLPLTPNPSYFFRYTWQTMPEVLEAAGISWKVYQSPDSAEGLGGTLLVDNVLRYFKQYATNPTLNAKALTPLYPGTFNADLAAGTLPQVSWIVTDFLQCEHPAAPPQYGESAVAAILDAVVSYPAIWEKTAIIVNFDENGGFFDHVPPPTAPPGTPGEYLTVPLSGVDSADGIAGPIGLGFRVPALVLSPYSRGGLCYSGTLDHTSCLRLLETRFGTPVPNLSAWRRGVVGDLTGAFDFAGTPTAAAPSLPSVPAEGTDLLVTQQLATNGLQATEGKGSPYPVPPNATPRQESGPARRQPSGVVACATPVATPTAGSAGAPGPSATTTAALGSTHAAAAGDLAFTGTNPADAVAATGLLAAGGAAALVAWRRRGQSPDDPSPEQSTAG
ncbi:MAG TPA: alkaline phosphatase family protein [Mycobacteriales bacterium]